MRSLRVGGRAKEGRGSQTKRWRCKRSMWVVGRAKEGRGREEGEGVSRLCSSKELSHHGAGCCTVVGLPHRLLMGKAANERANRGCVETVLFQGVISPWQTKRSIRNGWSMASRKYCSAAKRRLKRNGQQASSRWKAWPSCRLEMSIPMLQGRGGWVGRRWRGSWRGRGEGRAGCGRARGLRRSLVYDAVILQQ